MSLAVLFFSAIPAALFFRNLSLYTPPPVSGRKSKVSVLIPARNEESTIAGAIEAALANIMTDVEVVVLDDHSDDRTAAIVSELAARDGRIRLEYAPPLPAGWCGKQHACSVLAELASHDLLCFIDSDVRLGPESLSRITGFLESSGSDLVSGFPRQVTGTFLEKLLIPLIHFVLLGFLPLDKMRQSTHPAFAAGCGQLMFVRREAYRKAGGHSAIRSTLHDGLNLPKAFRTAGLRTDLFDATDVASCRMYTTAGQVWSGLAKNATEGLGAPSRILPVTIILLTGQVAPFVMAALWGLSIPIALAMICAWLPRFAAVRRFHQPLLSAVLHPLGILVLLAIQWYAAARSLMGRPSTWKGRSYQAGGAGERT